MNVSDEEMTDLLGRYTRVLERLGMLDGQISYRAGSKNAGEPYRIFMGNQSAPGTVGGMLGNTKSETYRSLFGMVLAYEDAAARSGQ